MEVPQQPGQRVRIRETEEGLEIVVSARRHLLFTAFLTVWLVGWALSESILVGAVVASVQHGSLDAAVAVVVLPGLLFWTLGGAFAVLVLGWQLAGRERLRLTTSSVVISREIGRLRQELSYDLDDVHFVRVVPPGPTGWNSFEFWGKGEGWLLFDHGDATVWFGNNLLEPEAECVAQRIRTALEERHPRS